tara:strand:+ start:10075 stop:11205 length:1131 start_codon:yes stop_codon:yes gene_type:complete
MNHIKTTCVHPIGKEGASVTTSIEPGTANDYRNLKELNYPGFLSTHNQHRLGEIIARLEGAKYGVAFNSGMTAISCSIFSLIKTGDHVLLSSELYGGTFKLATKEFIKRGISYSFVDNTLDSLDKHKRENTVLYFFETPSNPLLSITDLSQISNWAKTHRIKTVVDNTFATPVNQNPLFWGIDIVLHSGTKYLGGHNDLMFGVAATSDPVLYQALLNTAKIYGGALSPEICYLAERSIKTLYLRVQQQNRSAAKIAAFLNEHTKVKKVYYPGLQTHPDHQIAQKQMNGFGGMVSFEIFSEGKHMNRFLDHLKIISPAISLGGVESLISVPAVTSHKDLSSEEQKSKGITAALIRLSVGIEDSDDLIEDLSFALSKM